MILLNNEDKMKIKNVDPGKTVTMNGNTAIVLSSGPMGTRVDVIKGDKDSIALGKQIWSNESEVKEVK